MAIDIPHGYYRDPAGIWRRQGTDEPLDIRDIPDVTTQIVPVRREQPRAPLPGRDFQVPGFPDIIPPGRGRVDEVLNRPHCKAAKEVRTGLSRVLSGQYMEKGEGWLAIHNPPAYRRGQTVPQNREDVAIAQSGGQQIERMKQDSYEDCSPRRQGGDRQRDAILRSRTRRERRGARSQSWAS